MAKLLIDYSLYNFYETISNLYSIKLLYYASLLVSSYRNIGFT